MLRCKYVSTLSLYLVRRDCTDIAKARPAIPVGTPIVKNICRKSYITDLPLGLFRKINIFILSGSPCVFIRKVIRNLHSRNFHGFIDNFNTEKFTEYLTWLKFRIVAIKIPGN